jgi:hypothetical protein
MYAVVATFRRESVHTDWNYNSMYAVVATFRRESVHTAWSSAVVATLRRESTQIGTAQWWRR